MVFSSIYFILFKISLILIGILPSFSHAILAAIDPSIEDIAWFFVATIDNVEYAINASPAPTGSTRFETSESIE